MKRRLDSEICERKITTSRSQAENYIKLGLVTVNGKTIKKSSYMVASSAEISLVSEQYVSRAALKLASIADQFKLRFDGSTVLDIGSSTGGFTDFSLRHGANKVIAVDVGTDQLHPSLRQDKRIELYEKTDIRNVVLSSSNSVEAKGTTIISSVPELLLADVSFISLTKILPHVRMLMSSKSILIAMCKPQFEAGKDQINKGVVKNGTIRRKILKNFEAWLRNNNYRVLDKADSHIAGTHGNVERFYKLKKI